MKPDYDVIIAGGGPAGSTLAAYLAKADLSVLVVEGEHFPRPHVGESLVPSTTRVLLETGAMASVETAGFPKKYGAAWTSVHQGPTIGGAAGTTWLGEADVLFSERDQEGVDRDHTYHVDRAKFDDLLLANAKRCGAQVVMGGRVLNVDFDDPSQVSVNCRVADGEVTFSAAMFVDASGRQTLLGRQLRLKDPDPVFDQYVVHAWFDGLDRTALASSPEKTDYIYVHFLPVNDTWVWQIPITDTITSVGVVTQKHRFAEANIDRDKFFWDMLECRPDLREALLQTEQVRPFKVEADYSYAMRQICGDRFVMIGDAARFVDPIFSSGVSIALNSARFASYDIIAAFSAGDFGHDSFRSYEAAMRNGGRNWYNFITLYYRLNILFTTFIQDPRYRLDVIRLLQGDVWSAEEPEVLRQMRETVTAVENDPSHLWHPYLGSLRAPSLEPTF